MASQRPSLSELVEGVPRGAGIGTSTLLAADEELLVSQVQRRRRRRRSTRAAACSLSKSPVLIFDIRRCLAWLRASPSWRSGCTRARRAAMPAKQARCWTALAAC